MTLWFDVEDLITFFEREQRPTGIQRLSFEVFRELWKLGGATGLVRFCRHGPSPADYIMIDWPRLEADISGAGMNNKIEELHTLPPPVVRPRTLRHKIYGVISRLITPALRSPLGAFYAGQKQSLLALYGLCKALLVLTLPRFTPAPETSPEPEKATPEVEYVQFSSSDIFISLGAAWVLPNAAAGKHLKKLHGLRFAVLVHDLIPDLYPEWTAKEGVPIYRLWLQEVVPHADIVFANSENTARDLILRMADLRLSVPNPKVLPVGCFPRAHKDGVPASGIQELGFNRPFDRPFILFVSTIEVRKNHALLFRVWRRLISDLPAGVVPYLVFAGKIGWLTGDLLVQLDNADWLNGHIKHVQSPSEKELAALYTTCAFTVFPSLYEGWGLPVTESLSFGKTVAASNAGAILEAGGSFCTYFDPESVNDAYNVIRGLIENPHRVRQLEAHIAKDFHPTTWGDSATALLNHLLSAYDTDSSETYT